MDKALKKIKNQSRKTIRQADRSAEADARGRARVKVEKANKKANLDAAAFGAYVSNSKSQRNFGPSLWLQEAPPTLHLNCYIAR